MNGDTSTASKTIRLAQISDQASTLQLKTPGLLEGLMQRVFIISDDFPIKANYITLIMKGDKSL